ncbi:hypothetical protein AK830_g2966 [Neonectria ditissima]|uniref:EamA domain-containing protein n=1 Tax=Neonectria ditissima TaxID=78410 RepID=A0A0P7BDD2_9HYPO|nr:hypothetical protein AK830_g2966 [Neonectria ditissima]
MVRRRQPAVPESSSTPSSSPSKSLPSPQEMPAASRRTQWVFFAVASGACAAFNGVFAKLATTEITTSLSNKIAGIFGLSSHENIVEICVRVLFFVLNLTFNGVMWTLFTTALARGTSTTQVSIMNTSTNFVFTALLGFVIFSEALPPLWWAGAALLVAGNVIVGRKDETKDAPAAEDGYVPVPSERQEVFGRRDGEDEDVIDLGRESEDRSR